MTLANPANPSVRRWTREEYHRMGDLGFFDGQRVQLIEGEVIELAAQKDVHAITIGLVRASVARVFAVGFWIREQAPLSLGDSSEPEPDVSVVRGQPRDFLGKGHPTIAELVVEVSDTTLRFDREIKAPMYAAGIQDYWIINLSNRQVEVHRTPTTDCTGLSGYAEVKSFQVGESIAPLAIPNAQIPVNDLLP